MQDTPVAHWRFGEKTGGVANDMVGTHHATLIGEPGLGHVGAVANDSDTAIEFSGGGRASVGEAFGFEGGQSFTIEL